MRKQRKKKMIYLLFILLGSLGIGYAFLSQDLTINGTGKVTASSWHVYFDNLVLNQNNVSLSTGDSNAVINNATETDISYTITLNNPGDFYEFTVDVVNDGTIDAMIGTISNKLNNVEIDTAHPLPTYLKYSITYSDGIMLSPNHLLEAGETETYKVRIEYRTDITANDLPSTAQTLTLNFNVEYVQADSNAIERPPLIQLPEGRSKDNLQVGDEICINGATTECFNFIRYDGTNNEDIVMLAKYNLKVGNIVKNDNYLNYQFGETCTSTYVYTSNDIGYGLQNNEVIGWNSEDTYLGTVAFSYTNYWYDNSGSQSLKTEYGNSYPANIYDKDYAISPNYNQTCAYNSGWCTEGYSIAYYVEHYKNTLIGNGYGISIKDARLLTYEEATDSSIGCVDYDYCPVGFIRNTSFWLGTASNEWDVWAIESDGYFIADDMDDGDFNYDFYFGVRPVIVIEKSNI